MTTQPSQPMSDSNSDGDANQNADATAMCCSNFYEQDIVQELMGGSYHPGGADLSKLLVSKLGLPPTANVLDVACGVGTTTRMMASEFGLNATGLDFGEVNVQKAQALTDEALNQPVNSLPISGGSEAEPCCAPGDPCCSPQGDEAVKQVKPGKVDYIQGSADDLPSNDNSFDGVTCECAVSTFADQHKVAREFFRVLKPGGIFGMTDMVLNGELPAEFAEKVAPWTCMAKALTTDGYRELFESAGFEFVAYEDQSHTLLELATDMKRKLVMAGMGKAMGALPSLDALGMSMAEMRGMLSDSTSLVKEGTVQYGLLLFRKSDRQPSA